jgi:hypothetical protein
MALFEIRGASSAVMRGLRRISTKSLGIADNTVTAKVDRALRKQKRLPADPPPSESFVLTFDARGAIHQCLRIILNLNS